MLEQFESDPSFRQNAEATWHQLQAAQYNQPRQTEQPQQSQLQKKRRRHSEVLERKQELINLSVREQRSWDDQETQEFKRLETELPTLESEINRLVWDEQERQAQALQQERAVGQFQQQVGQRFATFAQPRIQQMNVSAAKKTELYNKMWQIFTSHPFYTQLVDISAADELMKFAYNELVVNHGAPKQRAAQAVGGRSDERYNDIDSAQDEQPKDRFAHMPPELAKVMREKYPHKAEVN